VDDQTTYYDQEHLIFDIVIVQNELAQQLIHLDGLSIQLTQDPQAHDLSGGWQFSVMLTFYIFSPFVKENIIIILYQLRSHIYLTCLRSWNSPKKVDTINVLKIARIQQGYNSPGKSGAFVDCTKSQEIQRW
jgi:hypothetical protein